MIVVFFNPDNTYVEQQTQVYLGWFFLIAVANLAFTVIRIGAFVLAGERLTRRLRTMAYRAILRQEVAFFDDKVNSVGRLATRLAADASEVKGATGEGLSLVFQATAAIVAGIIIAFVANWRLALVVTTITPLMIISALFQGKAFKGYAQGAAKAMEESGHIAVEATTAIRTVAAFNLNARMLASYSASLEMPLRSGYGKAMSAGTVSLGIGKRFILRDCRQCVRGEYMYHWLTLTDLHIAGPDVFAIHPLCWLFTGILRWRPVHRKWNTYLCRADARLSCTDYGGAGGRVSRVFVLGRAKPASCAR